jgi:hypothetical protein
MKLILIFLTALTPMMVLTACKPTPAPTPPPVVHVPADELKQPTPELASSMKLFVNESDLVSFIEITDVNLTANTRHVVWWYSDTPYLFQAFENFERTKPGKTAWLAGNKETVDRQLTILSTPYQCQAIKDTRLPIQIPTVLEYVTDLCVVPVPPEAGKFSGYIAVWMKREPTKAELSSLITTLQGFSRRHAAGQ